jgi:glycerophosphoryl diester phosphodiesterase
MIRPLSLSKLSTSLPIACSGILLAALVSPSLIVSGSAMMPAPAADTPAFVVAHRGASAYAPEHTLEAYKLAIAQGADYIEQDLGITKDGVLVCSHDPSLERVTNVEELFPDRFTEVPGPPRSGDQKVKRWFIEDLTLAEIKTLDAGSWFDPKFKGLKIVTFQEAIDTIKGKAGFFPELKTPGRVRAKGFDLEQAVVDALKKNGLVDATFKGRPAVHMQVFEEDSLRRLAKLLPTVPRSFLMGTPDQAKRWLTAEGLKEVKTFATGVAPMKGLIAMDPAIVTRAHEAGLTVVPYTFQLRPKTAHYADAPVEMRKSIEEFYRTLPDTPAALTAEIRKFVQEYKVDGLFTDNPDLFVR